MELSVISGQRKFISLIILEWPCQSSPLSEDASKKQKKTKENKYNDKQNKGGKKQQQQKNKQHQPQKQQHVIF